MRNIVKITLGCMLFLSVLAMVSACRKSSIVSSVTNRPNITRYLLEHPDEFSDLSKVLKLSGTASFLDAYGSYTFFAPNNTAIQAYLQSLNKATVEDVSGDDWKQFVRFHILEDSIATERFTDGKLPQLTMFGQYLVTGSKFESSTGLTTITVNKQANIVTPNISVGNGLIHSIDHVLTPASQTIVQILEQKGNFKVFLQGLKDAGLYDTLNVSAANNSNESRKFLTVIAESDQVLAAANITDLKAKYSKSGNPKSITDSLNIFLRYHIITGAKYLADIADATAHTTLAPLEVLTAKLANQKVYINDVVELPSTLGNISATNGVVNEAATHFGIIVRTPFRVDFDVCTFPELVKNKAYYGVANYFFSTAEAGSLSEIKFSGAIEDKMLIYRYGSGQGTSSNGYNRDVLVVPMATGGSSKAAAWVDFKTPLLVRGKYKVWIGYYTQQQSTSNGGTTTEVVASMSGENETVRTALTNAKVLNFKDKRQATEQTFDVQEALGYKTYMENVTGSVVSRLMGIVEVTQTGRCWLRLTAINGSQTTNNIDLIQFIPINDDQQYPKFKTDRTLILRP